MTKKAGWPYAAYDKADSASRKCRACETLPAGTYTLSTFSDDKFDGLILATMTIESVCLCTSVEIEVASADKPRVSFQRVGQQLFLTRIQTAYNVYNIPVPRSVIPQFADRSHGNGTASGN